MGEVSKCKSIKRLIPATCAWVLLLTTTALFFIFPCRRLQDEFHLTITIAQAVITFFVISNLFATTFVDPGIIKRANPDEDKDDFRAPIFEEVVIKKQTVRMKWCPTCQFYRPPRCSHCSVCDNCIEKFDHHCPWVNNCIGRRNYRHFFFFLIFLTIHMITIFIWCLLFVINNRKNLSDTAVAVSIVLLVIISLFFIPILGLTGFHIILVARGRTTNEQVTRKFNRTVNPYSEGIVYNCLYTLCGPRYPGLYKPKKSKTSSRKESNIRVYMDNNPDIELQQQISDAADFSSIENPKDELLERGENIIITKKSKYEPREERSTRIHHHNCNKSYNDDKLYNGMNQQHSEQDSHIVTMHHTENGTKETTFIALQSNNNSNNNNNLKSMNNNDNKATGLFQLNYSNNKISASKSTSINEISSHLKHHPNYHSPAKNINNYHHHLHHPINNTQTSSSGAGPDGGMLIYYSPDAGGGYISNNNTNTNKLFNSETELQNLNNSPFLYIDEDISVASTASNPNSNNIMPFDITDTNSKYNFNNKRPMNFQKALEISNQIEQHQQQQQQQTSTSNDNTNNNNRQSQYEMNYEISV